MWLFAWILNFGVDFSDFAGRQMKSEDFLVSQLISFSNWEKLWATGEGRIPS
jgi:hypothetical protein